ncbi:helix-turn-helix domain-containing protein [Euzebya tangerina]|uniref:helix-turn-helix domain-containing protein n=1 Tax=Euzebya tangerina TaxID=591198 RepID=UPI0013C2DD55|nr:helix-turn-helix domain-containing protein [Euzebya tangerina]
MTASTSGHGTWSASDLPHSGRLAGVRAALSDTHLPWQIDPPSTPSVVCDLRWHSLDDARVVECATGPIEGRRGRAELRRTDDEMLAVLLVMSGREHVRQGEVVVDLGAGDLLVWDSRVPASFCVREPLHKITLMVPRDRVPHAQATSLIAAERPLGALLSSQVMSLARVATDMGPVEAVTAVDVVTDLLSRTLAGSAPVVDGNSLLASRAMTIIEHELDDPDLGPTVLASRLGVSVRTLHLAFSSVGKTPAAHIRIRRLERVRRDLADPRMAARTITEMAHRWGFADAAHLSRTFKKAYGITPSAHRQDAVPS